MSQIFCPSKFELFDLKNLKIQTYHKILHIRPPVDVKKFMLKSGGFLICEDLTLGIKIESQE